MNDDLAVIEAALQREQNFLARQNLLKQRWKLSQAAAHVKNDHRPARQSKHAPEQSDVLRTRRLKR